MRAKVLLVLCAFAGSVFAGAQINQFPIDISYAANYSWNIFSGGNTMPTGNQNYNGVPFKIPSGAVNALIGFDGSSSISATLYPNVVSATTVYTLINTVYGQPGPASYLSIVFKGSAGASYTVNFVGGVDIRDFNTPTPFTDTINNTTTINAWTGPMYDGTHFHRLDMQIIQLPVAFANQTLTSVTITDNGNDNGFQRAILAAITVGGSALAGPPNPTVSSMVNAYNPQEQLAVGSLVTITGTNFGNDPAKVVVSNGAGHYAYVIPTGFTSTKFNVQMPLGASPGAMAFTVNSDGSSAQAFDVTLKSTGPACQTLDGSGTGMATVTTGAGQPVTLSSPAHSGDQVVLTCTGLGVTNPSTLAGPPTGPVAPAANPTVTVAGTAATGVSALTETGIAGVWQVKFTVPAGVQGTVPVLVSIGGSSSPAGVTIPLAGLSSVVNNASFANPGVASPGSIATVFANGLGTTTDQLSGVFPNSQSEGVQVTFNTEGGPIFHVVASPAQQQVDLLVPTDLPTSGNVNVKLSTSSGAFPAYTLNMVPANPGWYRIQDPQVKSRLNVIAQFANTTWLALPVSTTTALGLPACTKTTTALTVCGQPAASKDYLVIYATGLGLATPNGAAGGSPLATGQVAPVDGSTLYETPTLPAVTVGGVPATVLFSGLAPGFAGLYQIDIQVPDGVATGDDVPVKVTMAGASDTATISIQTRAN